jgi:nucleoside 2-deoxyribosyltransferase
MAECPICLEKITSQPSPVDNDSIFYECPLCGKYFLSNSVRYGRKLPHTASSWIQEQNKVNGKPPLITSDKYEMLKTIPDITLKHKLEIFMQKIYQCFDQNATSDVSIDLNREPSWLSLTWAKNEGEFYSIIEEANSMGLIESVTDNMNLMMELKYSKIPNVKKITFKGREFVESLGQTTVVSNKIFMAFYFTDEMKESFEETTKRAVTDASDGKLIAVRVSTSGTPIDTKIDDALITMLKSSKVVIADFTGQRQAVYYEAGYAMGMGIPVIWTCREDEVNKLSFDTRQYPHILWKDKDDLYKQLTARLSAQIL